MSSSSWENPQTQSVGCCHGGSPSLQDVSSPPSSPNNTEPGESWSTKASSLPFNSLRQRLIAITVILVLIDCVILIIWSAIDLPKEGLRKVDGEYHALCVADHFLPFFIILVLYKFLIIFVSAVLAWKSRNLPSAFSEARHIGFALYNAVFLMIIFIPIILALNDQPFFSWILAMLGLWLWFFTIFLLVIGFVHVGLFQDRHKPLKEKNLLPVSSSSRVSGSTTIEGN